MTTPAFDPLNVDIAAFAQQGGEAAGAWPLQTMDRLCEAAHAEARPGPDEHADWQVTGEARERRGGEPQIWLHLGCRAQLKLVCQRCLQPVEEVLQVQRSFQFAADEATAAAIDADSEDDVLVLSRTFNLIELVEDELLLTLPLVPRHTTCPQPLVPPEDAEPFEERPNPFAVLGQLKRKTLPN